MVKEGLPQGSSLSPILFNIFIAELHAIEDSNTKILQYADDFLLVSHDSNKEKAIKRLQAKANQFIEEAETLGAKVAI